MPRKKKKNHIYLNSRKKKKKSKRLYCIDQPKTEKEKSERVWVISCLGERKTTKKQLAHEKEW